MPTIIFEGVQGVGKSAIINALKEASKLDILPLPRTAATDPDQYVSKNMAKTVRDSETIIEMADTGGYYAVDRFAASEFVFGQICKRKQDYTWIADMEERMSKHAIMTAYIHTDYNFLRSNIWSRRGAYFADLAMQHMPEALSLYDKYLEITPIRFLSYKNSPLLTVHDNAGVLWNLIVEMLKTDKPKMRRM